MPDKEIALQAHNIEIKPSYLEQARAKLLARQASRPVPTKAASSKVLVNRRKAVLEVNLKRQIETETAHYHSPQTIYHQNDQNATKDSLVLDSSDSENEDDGHVIDHLKPPKARGFASSSKASNLSTAVSS